jgi:diguanylate cyclase (GGDEF)-like protein
VLLGDHAVEIGRGFRCPLVIESDSVSRRHAVVEWVDGAHRVTDLGSTNGTFLNEVRVLNASLADGDRLRLGSVLLKYIGGGNVEGAYHEEIQRLMRFDALTGVANRSHFDDALRAAAARGHAARQPIGLVLFDLDYFKQVNDTWGHPAGDSVLRQVADLVAGELIAVQLLARVGGEEFAVLWPGAELPDVLHLAESVRATVDAAAFDVGTTSIHITLSAGVASRGADSVLPLSTLYEQADARLYQAKRSGRNCVR